MLLPVADKTNANVIEIIAETIIPPQNHSYVFFGDILSLILCFPKKTPTKYAPISVANVPRIPYAAKLQDEKLSNPLNHPSRGFLLIYEGKNLANRSDCKPKDTINTIAMI